MALTKYAPNRDDAIKLIRFLVSEETQKIYAEVNYEFPVRTRVHLSSLLKHMRALNQIKYNSLILLSIEKMP